MERELELLALGKSMADAREGAGATLFIKAQLADLDSGGSSSLENGAAGAVSGPPITAALLFTDELERVIEICEAALSAARAHESPVATGCDRRLRWPR